MTQRIPRTWVLLTIALGFLPGALLFTACGPARQQTLVIGSKNFTEQVILGEMLAQHLEAKTGLHVAAVLSRRHLHMSSSAAGGAH